MGQEDSWIKALILTRNNVLVMADFRNMAVKWVSLAGQQPSSISSLRLKVLPCDLTLVGCNVIAVTSGTNHIILLKMESEGAIQTTIRQIRQIHTARSYTGVTSDEVTSEEPTSQLLVVSSMKDNLGPAVVDYVNGHGVVLWTILSPHSCPGLHQPCFLLLHGRELIISDQEGRGKVLRVDVVTGEATSPPLTYPDLSTPRQVAVDPAGNLYLSSWQEGCVLLCSPRADQGRRLIKKQDGEGREGGRSPQAVGVMGWRREDEEVAVVVVSWETDTSTSSVVGYVLEG